jgi:hypothetical protein
MVAITGIGGGEAGRASFSSAATAPSVHNDAVTTARSINILMTHLQNLDNVDGLRNGKTQVANPSKSYGSMDQSIER